MPTLVVPAAAAAADDGLFVILVGVLLCLSMDTLDANGVGRLYDVGVVGKWIVFLGRM